MADKRFEEITNALRNKASELLPPGSRLALYGSRSRGDARFDSDWDVLMLIPDSEYRNSDSYHKYAFPIEHDILLRYGEIINARIYSFSGWMKRKFLPFYKNVEHDKLILFQN